jgi:type II secretory pathway pseudopilin PulG
VKVSRHFRRRRGSQRGYILLVIVMMLTIALIAFTAMAPNEVTEIKRDREEEIIHRGKAYARGIKLFYKRFGRYPTSLNELQGTQNIKFIRQLYKDPMSPDGEWRIIHIGEAKYPPKGFGFSNIPGAKSIGTPIGGGPAGTQMTGGAIGGGAILPGGVGSILGGASSQLGSNQPSTGGMTPAEQISKPISGSAQNMMPVMGVASTNKSTSIHEVNERKKYDEWEFIYDPRYDIAAQMPQVIPGGVGGTMPGALNQQVMPTGTQPGTQQSPFGNTFGQPSGSPQPQPSPNPRP